MNSNIDKLPIAPRVSGAILAGGASSRMAANKALIQFHGKPLIARVTGALSGSHFIDDITLIANSSNEYEFLNLPVHADVLPGMGPLGGIYTALHYARHSHIMVAACDLPFITSELVDYLCEHGANRDVFVLESEKGVEPLCAVYAKSCLPVIKKHLEGNRLKVSDFYAEVDAEIVRLDAALPFYQPNLLANVNTPGELRKAETVKGKDKG